MGTEDFSAQPGQPDADALHLFCRMKLFDYGSAEFVTDAGLKQ